jgi:hypothetical protein
MLDIFNEKEDPDQFWNVVIKEITYSWWYAHKDKSPFRHNWF